MAAASRNDVRRFREKNLRFLALDLPRPSILLSLLSFFQMKSAVHLFNSGRKTILFLSFHTISQSILQNELRENRLFTFLHFFYQEILSNTTPHFVPRLSPVSKYSVVQNQVLLIQPFLTNFPQKTSSLLSVLSNFVKISKYFSNICRKFIAVQ